MAQTTGPFQFPMWGRPPVINIPGRQTHPLAELMAGVGMGMKAYAEAKSTKAKSVEEERRHQEKMTIEWYKAMKPGKPSTFEGPDKRQYEIYTDEKTGKTMARPIPGQVIPPKKSVETPEDKQRRAKELIDYRHEKEKEMLKFKKESGYSSDKPDMLNANQLRLLEDSLAEASEKIMLQSEEPAVRGLIDYFNRNSPSNRSVMHVWRKEKKVPGFRGLYEKTEKGKAERVDLPFNERLGRKYTIQDIKDIMKANPKDDLETVLLNIGAIK